MSYYDLSNVELTPCGEHRRSVPQSCGWLHVEGPMRHSEGRALVPCDDFDRAYFRQDDLQEGESYFRLWSNVGDMKLIVKLDLNRGRIAFLKDYMGDDREWGRYKKFKKLYVLDANVFEAQLRRS